jgi:hypothetical protein
MTMTECFRGRGITRTVAITNSAGDTITPGVNDRVRALLGRQGETAFLTVVDNDPSDNGSTITKGAENELRLDDLDMDQVPGIYELVFEYFDNANAQEWEMIDSQVFSLIELPTTPGS